IDTGMDQEDAEDVVRIGDFVTMDRDFIELGDHLSCKAFDDRMGVYVMLEALRRMQDHQFDIYAVATVQEEQGLRGATTGAYGIEPDLGVALDVTIAADIPGSSEHSYVTKLGKGTAIKIMDSASISNYRLVDFLRDLAEDKGIPYQMEILPRGGTDAGAMERSRQGCPVVTISIPTRYVHTVVESAHKGDVEASCDLLARFLEVAHEGDFSL
ncbi:MAG: M20/M25/M40 family metallo-hydrolase, partial [Halanaerobium sp.]|nr:M20/M25/M40 family metallo-hydrolase [Halanaerobium sp.]